MSGFAWMDPLSCFTFVYATKSARRTMRIMTVALAAAAVVAPVTVTLPAQAAQHGTVTKAEYRKIRGGMTSSQVAKVTGASGNYFYKGDIDWNAPLNERH